MPRHGDPPRFPRTTVAVLAGGRSRRFGSDKALAAVDGRTLLSRAVARLGPAFAETLVVADEAGRFRGLPARVIADRFRGCGPLAGVHAALEESPHDFVVVVTVDSPHVDPPLLDALVAAVVGGAPAAAFERESFIHPFPSAYRRRECLEAARALLHAHARSGDAAGCGGRGPRLLALLAAVGAAYVPLPPPERAGEPDPLADIDTPEDLAAVAGALGRTSFSSYGRAARMGHDAPGNGSSGPAGGTPARVAWVRPPGVEPCPVAVAVDPEEAARAASVGGIGGSRRLLFVGDSAVQELHGAAVREALAAPASPWLTFAPGEAGKTRGTVERLQDAALAAGIDRDTVVVAVGGGVSTDLGGFLAATLLRGLRWIAFPTTLVGAVDAAIGGKTGVDVPSGKNLVGAFHHPVAVIVGTRLLLTLPERERRAGWSEVIKHGVVADGELFESLERDARAPARWDAAALVDPVARSAAVKAAVVGEDPLERGRRAILNYGHTVGHALETVTGWTMSHGEAVAVGMIAEARLAVGLGLLGEGDRARIERLVAAFGLPVRAPAVAAADVAGAMRTDKKRRGGEVRFSLPTGLGDLRPEDGSYTRPVPDDLLAAALGEVGCSA